MNKEFLFEELLEGLIGAETVKASLMHPRPYDSG